MLLYEDATDEGLGNRLVEDEEAIDEATEPGLRILEVNASTESRSDSAL